MLITTMLLISVDMIQFDFELKRETQKSVITSRRKKKKSRKKVETHPLGIKFGSVDSKSDALTTGQRATEMPLVYVNELGSD